MSLCGVGYLEGHLELLEANPDNPGQALYDKLPRDKQGELRVSDNPPPFLAAIVAGSSPAEALTLAIERDLDFLMAACRETWRLGNEAEDQGVAYQEAVAELTLTITERDIHLVGQARSAQDNPTIVKGGTLKINIANIRHLVRNLWLGRQWLGDGRRRLQKYTKAIGIFSYAVPGAGQKGRILVNAEKERARIQGSKGNSPA
jgi:hypothetical protein